MAEVLRRFESGGKTVLTLVSDSGKTLDVSPSEARELATKIDNWYALPLKIQPEEKCPKCNNYNEDFISKDNGQTQTNDKGIEWDMARCMHCSYDEMRDDLFEPKDITVKEV